MRGGTLKARFTGDESGFTLTEMMVTITIMIVVLFALYNIFDMSIRVFSFGNDKVEAVENARIGLERMEREIRGAFPVNGATATPRYRFFNANGSVSSPPAQFPATTQITFGNELGATGDGTVRCPASGPCEYITYRLSAAGADPNAPRTLQRINVANSTATGDTVVEYIVPPDTSPPIDPNQYGLRFTYLTSSGATASTDNGTAATDVAIVRIEVQVDTNGAAAGGGTQTLATEVDLRN